MYVTYPSDTVYSAKGLDATSYSAKGLDATSDIIIKTEQSPDRLVRKKLSVKRAQWRCFSGDERMLRNPIRSFAAVLILAGCVLVSAAPVNAQRLCPSDRPCITDDYQSGRTIIVGWSKGNWSHFNVRWSRPGRGESQHEVGRNRFYIRNVLPGVPYTVKVQGCRYHFLAGSVCTPWNQIEILAAGAAG